LDLEGPNGAPAASTPTLLGSLTIEPNPGWQDKNPKGLKYKEKSGDQDGVITVQLIHNSTPACWTTGFSTQ